MRVEEVKMLQKLGRAPYVLRLHGLSTLEIDALKQGFRGKKRGVFEASAMVASTSGRCWSSAGVAG